MASSSNVRLVVYLMAALLIVPSYQLPQLAWFHPAAARQFGFFNNFNNLINNIATRTTTTTTSTTFTVTVTNTCTRVLLNNPCLAVPVNPGADTAYQAATVNQKFPFPLGFASAAVRSLEEEMEKANRERRTTLHTVPNDMQDIDSSIHYEDANVAHQHQRVQRQLVRTSTLTFTWSTTTFITALRTLVPSCSTPGFFVPC